MSPLMRSSKGVCYKKKPVCWARVIIAKCHFGLPGRKAYRAPMPGSDDPSNKSGTLRLGVVTRSRVGESTTPETYVEVVLERPVFAMAVGLECPWTAQGRIVAEEERSCLLHNLTSAIKEEVKVIWGVEKELEKLWARCRPSDQSLQMQRRIGNVSVGERLTPEA
ncbi:hypothetical protein H6P81_016908 [Aristolochia fimbriata]|uniref:Uncharacterized protein n=1 Tax=Aristolochia fimbriata TaxID=158543 RepID=A0AAV7DYH0_ARIFI|nr:hypothetical protein H6P81_016908 [Aristolochia fimbriata]